MTPRKMSPPPALHELEAEVMEEIWQRDDATVREVLEALNQGPKQRAYTTVMTIMVRLDRKGLLRRKRRGKSDVYRATMTRADYLDARASSEVAALLEQYGEVALGHFANQVEALDPERLEQLRALARGD